ncbi:MAG: (d)CMP kinase [Candidatus Neomarinimicrobiota bacterium]
MIIAIDGPAASGKSTTARGVAIRLGFVYLDTGAMYRAVTLAVLKSDIALHKKEALEELLATLELNFQTENGKTRILLHSQDVTDSIRSLEVTRNVSAVSAMPMVRGKMVAIQRDLAGKNDSVVEGRDIGTVVFPDADFKFFLTADYRTRALRRLKDLAELGIEQSIDEVIEELKRRDEKDSSRSHSPLKKAEDAVEVDTTALTIPEQIDFIVTYVGRKLGERTTNQGDDRRKRKREDVSRN